MATLGVCFRLIDIYSVHRNFSKLKKLYEHGQNKNFIFSILWKGSWYPGMWGDHYFEVPARSVGSKEEFGPADAQRHVSSFLIARRLWCFLMAL